MTDDDVLNKESENDWINFDYFWMILRNKKMNIQCHISFMRDTYAY